MSIEFETPYGTIEVAETELTLFFNNDTIRYAWEALAAGMTKAEAIEALVARGFQEEIAEAFLKYQRNQGHLFWEDGRLKPLWEKGAGIE